MKKHFLTRSSLLLLLLLVLNSFSLYADNEDDEPDVRDLTFKERVYVGGSLGLQISNFATFVDVSPMVGYRLTNRLSSGIGLKYQYYHEKLIGYGTHVYGGSVFAKALIIPQAFIYGEFETLNLEAPYFRENSGDRFWEQNYFAGLGFRQQIGPKAFFNIMLLYNFNDDSFVYFQNPIFRFSIEIGL